MQAPFRIYEMSNFIIHVMHEIPEELDASFISRSSDCKVLKCFRLESIYDDKTLNTKSIPLPRCH